MNTDDIKESNIVGRKDDDGKLRWDLLPLTEVKKIVEVLTYGANKYGANNWQHVDSERYVAALFRHLYAWRCENEPCDKETGYSHLAHALTNLIFLSAQEESTCKKN